jgi:hypothetical protein
MQVRIVNGQVVSADDELANAKPSDQLSARCNERPERRSAGPRRTRADRRTASMIVTLLLSGCAPAVLTALSVGGSAGIQHTVNGISYRTFTAPMPEVRAAARTALGRMGVTNITLQKMEEGEVISAKAGDRIIEVELTSITPKATRMRTMVRNGVLMDSATGTEIIVQTERTLGNGKRA